MECNLWPLMLLVFACPLTIQGHKACYEDSVSWVYHKHSHSCFKIVKKNTFWTNSQLNCSQQLQGSGYEFKKHLAKLGDSATNAFVKGLLPSPGWLGWMGLHYVGSKGAFRWDGYPDEKVVYKDPTWDSVPWKPLVALRKSGWTGKADRGHHFVCQHQAKKIGTVTCQQQVLDQAFQYTCVSSKSPTKAMCQWKYTYDGESDQVWTQVAAPTYTSETLNNQGAIIFTTTCSFTLTDVKPGMLNIQMRMYPKDVGIDLSDNAKASAAWALDFNIAKPNEAKFVVDGKDVTGLAALVEQGSDNVIISCNLDNGSPQVSSTTVTCSSPIENNATKTDETPSSYSIQIGHATGNMHGRNCTCWGNHVTGRTEDVVLTFNFFTKPNTVVCQSDLGPTRLLVTCQTDKVFPQAECTFLYRYETEDVFNPMSATASVDYSYKTYGDIEGLHYYQSNCSMTLTHDVMAIRSGNVTVQVTMNPKVNGLDKDTTGRAFVSVQEIVNIELPNKPQFKMNNKILDSSSPIYFIEKDTIVLNCDVTSGNPSVASVSLSCDFPFTDSDGNNTRTSPGSTYVMNEIASRYMNGKSCTCIGNHLIQPVVSSPLTFNITTRLSHCKEEENGDREVKLDQTFVLILCLAAFPSPSSLEVQSATESGWQVNKNITVTIDSEDGKSTNVTITFPKVKATDLGQYRLYDPNVLEPVRSYWKLSLSEKPSAGGGGDVGPIIGAVVSVIIVIIIVVIIVVFIIRRRRRKNRRKREEATLAGGQVQNEIYGNKECAPVDASTVKKLDENKKRSYGPDDYAQVNLSTKKKNIDGKEKNDTVIQVYDNDGFVKENDKNKDDDNGKEDDTERPYSNMIAENTKADNKTSDSKMADGEEDGDLLYIQLDFNCKTGKQVKPKKKSKPKRKPEKVEEEDEQTEYAAICAKATIRVKMEREKEEEERRKAEEEEGDENEEEGDGVEEAVYENVQVEDNLP